MDVEQRARELLAAEYARRGSPRYADEIRDTELVDFGDDDIAVAVRAIIAALAPQWQPIESAPKDTVTEILAWDGYDMRVTRWCFPYKGHPGAWYESEDRYEKLFWEPTHWQPLPAPPEERP